MRTNIEIDERLLRRAKKLSGLPTKRAVVQRALESFVGQKSLERFFELVRESPAPPEFLAQRGDELPEERELF